MEVPVSNVVPMKPEGEQPSQTLLMLAAAQMHSMDRLKPKDETQTAGLMGDLWNKVTGGSSEPAPKMIQGDRTESYPTSEDAAFARKQDYAYGKEWEPFFNNLTARIMGRMQPDFRSTKKNPMPDQFQPQTAAG